MKVEVHGVRVDYGRTRVGPFDLSFGPGVHRVVGPNGAGKSTLLGVISTAVRRSTGTVLLDGLDPDLHPRVRARTGYVPSLPLLPGVLTVTECWRLMSRLRRADWSGAELCERLSLPPHIRLDQCSAGMRKKAEWVAALAGDPDLLLLDEPFDHLDVESREVVLEQLNRPGRTVILVHHGELPAGLGSPRPCSLREDGPEPRSP